jgi:hypothetical protein
VGALALQRVEDFFDAVCHCKPRSSTDHYNAPLRTSRGSGIPAAS